MEGKIAMRLFLTGLLVSACSGKDKGPVVSVEASNDNMKARVGKVDLSSIVTVTPAATSTAAPTVEAPRGDNSESFVVSKADIMIVYEDGSAIYWTAGQAVGLGYPPHTDYGDSPAHPIQVEKGDTVSMEGATGLWVNGKEIPVPEALDLEHPPVF